MERPKRGKELHHFGDHFFQKFETSVSLSLTKWDPAWILCPSPFLSLGGGPHCWAEIPQIRSCTLQLGSGDIADFPMLCHLDVAKTP